MRKLIIGCGYLGRRVADAWLAKGHHVSALTRSAKRAALFRSEGIEPISGDVTQPDSLAGLPDADTLLYAVGFDRTSGKSQREIYVEGLENVLKCIGSRTGRMLYISSTSVYGQSQGEWVDESSPCEPASSNGRICLEAEQLIRDYFLKPSQGQTSAANVLRLAGIYGPGRLLRRLEEVKSGQPIAGSPDAWLNLIHVDDAVGAVLACEQNGQPGETYLISDDRPISRREYYETLAELVSAPVPEFNAAEQSPGLNKRCSNRKLHGELKPELRFPTIREGLPHALQPEAEDQ